MTDDALMTIGEMCAAFDVTPRTLRFYEAKELLFPLREGSRRLFTRRDRARLKLILRGKRFGFSLEEIRQLLDLYDMGDQQVTQLTRTYRLALERRRIMQEQLEELRTAIGDLEDQLELVGGVLREKGVEIAPLTNTRKAINEQQGAHASA
ncbi:MAG: MerR family transcriptional regulator [Rubricella sp.]